MPIPENAKPKERKAEILAASHERGSMRAMTRIFGVNRNTVLAWLKRESSKSREPAALEENTGNLEANTGKGQKA